LASELEGTNIKVNSVHPGWVKTELGSDAAPTSIPDGAITSVAVALLGADGPNGRFIQNTNQELPCKRALPRHCLICRGLGCGFQLPVVEAYPQMEWNEPIGTVVLTVSK
jgi:hypothetical protein